MTRATPDDDGIYCCGCGQIPLGSNHHDQCPAYNGDGGCGGLNPGCDFHAPNAGGIGSRVMNHALDLDARKLEAMGAYESLPHETAGEIERVATGERRFFGSLE